ncbi:related to pisatin demethylase / cytochrome P450 monooxygenase [Cephalotrichum gorgonifer]|uniref:Related to pisatin demethylase / cytochrome P450 monooxygenase n=1 Tax=Cephalotrichum gorgonifer TaxID=2041049 RepID=A0AAE8SX82_9PEZI|nr:related to pisatin demethylase / cytochrome P450 monooxygenase [Cephalotrichum gorgonifer]
MESKVQGVLDSLWDRFDEFAESGQPLNLSTWASYFTYDVVGTLCLSEPMGFVREGCDPVGFIENIHGAFYWIANLGFLPGQTSWIGNPVTEFLAPRLGLHVTNYAKAFQRLSVDKVFERRNAGPQGKKADMLDHFISMTGRTGEPATIPEIMAEIGNMLAAGADTTSTAIKAVLGPLLRDPIRYRRLRDEVDTVKNASPASASGQALTYNMVKDLPFLSGCIKEGIRMHPSIVYQLPRHAPAGGTQLEGYYIDPSCTISMSPLAQNRCNDIFGPDPDEWRPERWIAGEGNSEEQIKFMEKNLATFGYGSRICIGKNLALFELYKFLAQLLARFDVEAVDTKTPCGVRSMWFAEIDNLKISLKKR